MKLVKKLLLKVKTPAKKTAIKNPIKYPIVGPVKYTKPTPFSGVPAKTGIPAIPSSKYNDTVNKPSFHPYITPNRRTTKVCIVIGTGQKGIFIFADAANIIVPKIAKNKLLIKEISFKLLINSIFKFLLLFSEKSTYLLLVKRYPLNHLRQ